MSDVAVLRFLPWMRRGLARALGERADDQGLPRAAVATVEAAVTVAGEEVTRSIHVRGPGAVVGLGPGQVVRQEPQPGTTDFETNYFPYVELLSADLPWMFTAAAAGSHGLAPWLVLVVVEDRDGNELANPRGGLRVLSVDDAGRELPRLSEAWPWAHVQASLDLADGTALDLESELEAHPEAFTARLICPRRLSVDTWYHACLVPVFEQGRRAGLGLGVDPTDVSLAWTEATTGVELPVYHAWRFRTAAEPGDFESLVKKLRARTLDDSVGVKDLEIGEPGSDRLPQEPGTRVGYVGALVSPNLEVPQWPEGHRTRFQPAIRQLLNQALARDGGEETTPTFDPLRHDPVVAPPAYGALPADVDTVPPTDAPGTVDEPKWLSEANLDPAHRAVAGRGSEVVRRNQENLVAVAWEQAAALRDVNRVLNRSRLALEVGKRLKLRLDTFEDGALLQLSRGAHGRLKTREMDKTLRGRLAESTLPAGLVSGAFRRRLRPGTTAARAAFNSSTQGPNTATLASGLTQEFVQDTDAKLSYATLTVPHGVVFEDQTTQEGDGQGPTGSLLEALRTEFLVSQGPQETVLTLPRRTRSVATRTRLSGERTTVARSSGSGEAPERSRAAEVGDEPRAAGPPSVAGTPTGAALPPGSPSRPPEVSVAGGPGEIMGERVVPETVLVSSLPVAVDPGGDSALDIALAAQVVRSELDPAALLRVRVRATVTAPPSAWSDEDVPAAMGFSPQYPDPVYELLVKIDPELLLPGVGEIPADTVALAKVNAAFVEAFLLGANHELSREFVWREVPADPADTWLRTFWDSAAAGVEDIEPVALWDPPALGSHQAGMDPDQVLVLIVKGDLLRRYPKTLVYAVAGRWQRDEASGDWERVEAAGGDPLFPIFTGSLGRDVVFLGFMFDEGIDVDLDVAGSADRSDQRPGWFFAFEQPSTQPRFGLDVGREQQAGRKPRFWKNVSWFHALADTADSHAPLAPLDGTTRAYDDEGSNTWEETWGRDAAAMARITLQRPVRMLVHADQMLRPDEEEQDGDESGEVVP